MGYRSKGDVELRGLTKAGKVAKKPFAYITTAQNNTLAEMQAAGFSLDDMMLCVKHVDSELYGILKIYKEKRWEKAAVFGYTYMWPATKEDVEKYHLKNDKMLWFQVRPAVISQQEKDNWKEILEQWKRYEDSWQSTRLL